MVCGEVVSFSVSGWTSEEEKYSVIKWVYEIVPVDSEVVILKDQILVEVIFGNHTRTHEEGVSDLLAHVLKIFKEEGLENIKFERKRT